VAQAPSVSTIARTLACDAVVDLLDTGNEPAQLRIYSGVKPTNAEAALSGNTQLAALVMSDPAFGAAVNGQAVAGPIASDVADANGTATFFRCGSMNSGVFTTVIQGEIGTAGSDINLNATALAIGGLVAVSSLTYTQYGG
jgi:hypothetical protein